jgi:hypothetical protein
MQVHSGECVMMLKGMRSVLKEQKLQRCVEALTRAGEYDPGLLNQAVKMFEVRVMKYGKGIGLMIWICRNS